MLIKRENFNLRINLRISSDLGTAIPRLVEFIKMGIMNSNGH